MQAEKPVDDVERELVAKMVRHTWMAERAVRFQDGCFLILPQSPEQEAARKDGIAVRNDIELHMRYQTSHDRAYQRAANDLAKRRAERRKAEIGFESQKRKEAEETRKAELHPLKVAAAKARVATANARLERRNRAASLTKQSLKVETAISSAAKVGDNGSNPPQPPQQLVSTPSVGANF
jgi:hypothetical protein